MERFIAGVPLSIKRFLNMTAPSTSDECLMRARQEESNFLATRAKFRTTTDSNLQANAARTRRFNQQRRPQHNNYNTPITTNTNYHNNNNNFRGNNRKYNCTHCNMDNHNNQNCWYKDNRNKPRPTNTESRSSNPNSGYNRTHRPNTTGRRPGPGGPNHTNYQPKILLM